MQHPCVHPIWGSSAPRITGAVRWLGRAAQPRRRMLRAQRSDLFADGLRARSHPSREAAVSLKWNSAERSAQTPPELAAAPQPPRAAHAELRCWGERTAHPALLLVGQTCRQTLPGLGGDGGDSRAASCPLARFCKAGLASAAPEEAAKSASPNPSCFPCDSCLGK